MSRLKVFLDPPQNLSQAMFRVAKQLRANAPADVEIVKHAHQADLQVLHVTGATDLTDVIATTKSYSVIQYCYKTAGGSPDFWSSVWRGARLVWSYYDLCPVAMKHFYYAPLGVDPLVFNSSVPENSRYGVFTSGYVSGPQAEAIEEVANAALYCKLPVYHLGPGKIEGMATRTERSWHAESNISDQHLARVLRTCRWVSGLRQIEGFELSVLEGFACGARPIVFDRPDMRAWYRDIAVFIPPTFGSSLEEYLKKVFETLPGAVTDEERSRILPRFDWATIASGFWEALLG